jgi:hypothetical protein
VRPVVTLKKANKADSRYAVLGSVVQIIFILIIKVAVIS